jgi:hypothetical protein
MRGVHLMITQGTIYFRVCHRMFICKRARGLGSRAERTSRRKLSSNLLFYYTREREAANASDGGGAHFVFCHATQSK